MRKKCTIFALANKENRSVDHLTIHRGVEQLAARRAHNPEVGGSSPPPATTTGETAMFLLFSFAGVGLERLISTILPNLPLIREACGKTLSCIASQYEWLPQCRG